jgi:hypothetical protein
MGKDRRLIQSEGSGCLRLWVAAFVLALLLGAACALAHLVFH